MSAATTLDSMPGFNQPALLRTDLSIEDRIRASWYDYLVGTLGCTKELASLEADLAVARSRGKRIVDDWLGGRTKVRGSRILDVGSGHGEIAIELALAGANVTAVEPCDAWRKLSEEWALASGVLAEHIGADAHELPFPNESFDAVVSFQVLEHVRDPKQVIREISRVLKPGGRFVLSCENYLSFREQHYRVAWFPCLPKSLGSIYLRLRGRDPTFLKQHVRYVYWPRLAYWLIESGLIDDLWRETIESARSQQLGWKGRASYRAVNLLFGRTMAEAALVYRRQIAKLFRIGFYAAGVKVLR